MATELLPDIRNANHAISRLVSELPAAKASPPAARQSIHLESLTEHLNRMEKILKSLPPPESRDAELAKELETYEVNLGLLKKSLEDLGPVLEGKIRLAKDTIARLGAASNWSDALKNLSK